MTWYVLRHANRYLGQQWEMSNARLIKPRTALVDLGDASIYPGINAALDAAARAAGTLGGDFQPVPIRLEGSGRETRCELLSP